MTPDEEPESCSYCGWEGPTKHYDAPPLGNDADLCEVCANTSAGTAAMYPGKPDSEHDVLKTMAWGINSILAAIREKQ